jgi:hypothetical protein
MRCRRRRSGMMGMVLAKVVMLSTLTGMFALA